MKLLNWAKTLKVLLIVILIMTTLLILINFLGIFQFRTKDHKIVKKANKQGIEISFGFENIENHNLHYIYSKNNDSNQTLCILHGTPGSASNFEGLLLNKELLQHYNLLLIDRPGFGFSDFGNGIESIHQQADIIEKFLINFNQKIVLAGHSLGGPLAAILATRDTINIVKLHIWAGSANPELEPNDEKIRSFMAKKAVRWAIPKAIRVSNEELLQHRSDLIKLDSLWNKIICPVTIIHGTKDKLVPFGNVEFIANRLNQKPKIIEIPKGNHFFPFTKPEMIARILVDEKHP